MKLIGLLLSALVLGLIFYKMYGQHDAASGSASSATATLGAPPPTNIATQAQVAKQYTRNQTCLANCAAEDRTCSAMAMDPTAVAACAKTKSACESRCP